MTFIAMLALADKDGTVDMTPQAIAAKSGFPLEIVQAGISELEKPDPESRTPDEEGRRITLVSDTRSWGWQITNYVKYRDIRTAEERREYMRQYMRKRRANSAANSTNVSKVSLSDAEANAKADSSSDKREDLRRLRDRLRVEKAMPGARR